MNRLLLTAEFERSMRAIRDTRERDAIWKKIQELKRRAPIGKKLIGNPYWSLRIGRHRVIYQLRGDEVLIGPILERENEYREL